MAKRKTKRMLKIMAVIGLLIFLHYFRILKPAENAIALVLRPFTNWCYSLSFKIKSTYSKQAEKIDLNNVVAELREENRQLVIENVNLKRLEEENEKLRQHLKFLSGKEYIYILANIISQGSPVIGDSSERLITIDKGKTSGLAPGLAVVSDKGIIIGKIRQVDDYISQVDLTVSTHCKLAAGIQNGDKTIGLAHGDLGLTVKMDLIPQTENIKIGDNVVTSGLESNIPLGLVIGKVSEVIKDSNEVWQSATIEPLVDVNDLVIVSVILP